MSRIRISRRRYARLGEWRTVVPKKGVYIHIKKVGDAKSPARWKVEHIRYVGKKKVKIIRER